MSFVISNQISKTSQQKYAASVKNFTKPPKILHPIYSTPYSSVKKESMIVKKIIEANPDVVAYPKTPPRSDGLALVSAFLRSPKVELVDENFIKTCLELYPHLGIEAACNIYLPFHLRFYSIKNASFYYKLLLLSSSTEFSLDDVRSIFATSYKHYDLGIIADIVFNKPEALGVFFENEIFSVASCPNLTSDMINTIIESANLRKHFHRESLAELAVNPWVPLDFRVKIISLLFKHKPKLRRSALRVVSSIPFVNTAVSYKSFPKFFKNFNDNSLGLASWASGSFSLQGFINQSSVNLQVAKNKIFDSISEFDPLLPVYPKVDNFTRRFSANSGVKILSNYTPESQLFVNKVISSSDISFLGKVASILVCDLEYSSLTKHGALTKSSFLVGNNNTYNKHNVLASFIFFREFLDSPDNWECFLSLAPSFNGNCLEFINVIKTL
jgi:hypothetical protein